MEVLNTPDLSLGPKLSEFEEKFAQYIGSRHAIAVNSGTSALHLVVRALGLKKGDAVITTPFSFIASANCLLFEEVLPVFVDIDRKTYNIDVQAIIQCLEHQTDIKGILAVHIFGEPCNMQAIMEVAWQHNLLVIEDACEALGAAVPMDDTHREGQIVMRKAGSIGAAGTFAFYPNKQITTGEGGMIVTNSQEVAELCRSMRNQGRGTSGAWLAHERLGYNYRISDINCALGIAQISRIDEILSKRKKVANMYAEALSGIDGLHLPYTDPAVERSWFVYVVCLSNEFSQGDRDAILEGLREKGISCGNYFSPIHLQPFYIEKFGYKSGDFPITEQVAERSIALPFYNNLTADDISYIAGTLRRLIQ
jgi:perosamine synthetase